MTGDERTTGDDENQVSPNHDGDEEDRARQEQHNNQLSLSVMARQLQEMQERLNRQQAAMMQQQQTNHEPAVVTAESVQPGQAQQQQQQLGGSFQSGQDGSSF